jgi:hypothetical protein
LKRQNKSDLVVYSVLWVIMHFFHTYTWTILSIIISIFLLVSLWRSAYKKRAIVFLFIAIAATAAIDAGRVAFTGSSGGIERDLKIAQDQTGPDQFVMRWNNLSYSLFTFLGGIFGNVIILGIGLIWLLKAKMWDNHTILLMIFFSVGLVPVIFGDYVVQTRLLYNIPFQVPVAIVLADMARKRWTVIAVAACIWLLVIAIRTTSNFHLVLPG